MKKERKKRVSLKEYFCASLDYIRENKKYIYTSIILFFISAIIGVALHSHLSYLDEMIKEILDKAANLSGLDLIAFIFKNNLLASFYFLFLGIILGIIPLVNSITNGLLIGYVCEKVASTSSIIDLWRLLPHGIFELPAIFISAGLGIKLGMAVFSKNERKKINENLTKSMITFILVIIPLLIIAAIIEGLLITLLG
jgi:stage II sporulation protein M